MVWQFMQHFRSWDWIAQIGQSQYIQIWEGILSFEVLKEYVNPKRIDMVLHYEYAGRRGVVKKKCCLSFLIRYGIQTNESLDMKISDAISVWAIPLACNVVTCWRWFNLFLYYAIYLDWLASLITYRSK